MPKEHRRALHRIPEVGWNLPETAAYIKNALNKLPCEVFSPVEPAVCAWFDFGKGQAVAFRADMDALPISEETSHDFPSRHPGQMHACGHDGHMSILLALAEKLAQKREAPYNVLLIFEPAEETDGGAEPICRSGILEKYNVREIYGLHLWPELPLHTVGSRPGGMMSRSCELTLHIHGSSAHIARWQEAKDALWAANRIMAEFYALADTRPCLLRFGKMEAGQVRNSVAEEAVLLGTLRAFDDVIYEELRQKMEEIAARIAGESGCNIEIACSAGYPPVCNDADLFARAARLWAVERVDPTYITEDFSAYQQRVPGLFFWLGTGSIGLHDPKFDFDETVLDTGLSLFLTMLEGEV